MTARSRFTAFTLLIVAATTLLVGLPPAARAQGRSSEAALILRILSYDRNLRGRASQHVTVLVLYKSGDGASESARSNIVRSINEIGRGVTVGGLPARAVDHSFTDSTALVRAARSVGAAAVFVCPGLSASNSQIAQATRRASLLSITQDEGSVRAGLSVGIVRSGSRLRLVVNVNAARSEGARLDAALLRLAQVVR